MPAQSCALHREKKEDSREARLLFLPDHWLALNSWSRLIPYPSCNNHSWPCHPLGPVLGPVVGTYFLPVSVPERLKARDFQVMTWQISTCSAMKWAPNILWSGGRWISLDIGYRREPTSLPGMDTRSEATCVQPGLLQVPRGPWPAHLLVPRSEFAAEDTFHSHLEGPAMWHGEWPGKDQTRGLRDSPMVKMFACTLPSQIQFPAFHRVPLSIVWSNS